MQKQPNDGFLTGFNSTPVRNFFNDEFRHKKGRMSHHPAFFQIGLPSGSLFSNYLS